MKWGGKKPSSSSSSRPFLISHVFPSSWLTKFKQMGINSGGKHKGKQNSASSISSQCAKIGGGGGGGRFYGGEDGDEFWRLSFGENVIDGKKDTGFLNSFRYDSEEEEPEFPPSSCQTCRSIFKKANGKQDADTFMVSDARKMRGIPIDVEVFPTEKGAEIRTPRLRIKKKNHRRTEGKTMAQNSTELQPGRKLGMIEREDFYSVEERLSFEWQKLKEMKIGEVKSKNEKQRKSLYISRELQRKRPKQSSSKVKVFSPRTSKAEACKIKALEDMKKSRLKTKKKAEDTTMEGHSGFESSAVVKFSHDPQKDFRDSMMEMIQANKIAKPEELEELLACYLTLNSDLYHDLIIKVFRHVWFDLNQPCSDTEPETEQSL